MPKPKRKTRGIVAWAARRPIGGLYGVFETLCKAHRALKIAPGGDGWKASNAYRAGCPRLKPGEARKVRVVIEEVKPQRKGGDGR